MSPVSGKRGGIIYLSPAKLNLSLSVSPPRPDGYHPIRSIFQTISVFDLLHISTSKGSGFTLTGSTPEVPIDDDNILSKIYAKFANEIPFMVSVHIEKNIPIGGGLGGGSSNAAAFIRFLNDRIGWKKTPEELAKIGAEFGSDIPFFFFGGRALVTGTGDIVSPLPYVQSGAFVLINPRISISSKAMYHKWDDMGYPHTKEGELSDIGSNDLMAPVWDTYPIYKEIEDTLKTLNAPPICLSGSGGTTFIHCESQDAARQWQDKLRKVWPTYWVKACQSTKDKVQLYTAFFHPPSPKPQPTLEEWHFKIQGKVQGVFYRVNAQMMAQSLGLVGWVENNADGTVTLVAQGTQYKLELLAKWCEKGPERAVVSKVDISHHSIQTPFSKFEIRE